MLTYQIRVHAQHLKHCVLGDEAYGGMGGGAVAALTRHLGVGGHGKVKHLMAGLERPCLHAQTLGWEEYVLGKGWEGCDVMFQSCFWCHGPLLLWIWDIVCHRHHVRCWEVRCRSMLWERRIKSHHWCVSSSNSISAGLSIRILKKKCISPRTPQMISFEFCRNSERWVKNMLCNVMQALYQYRTTGRYFLKSRLACLFHNPWNMLVKCNDNMNNAITPTPNLREQASK